MRRTMPTYDECRIRWIKDHRQDVRSIYVRSDHSVFSNLALPASGNHGQFVRAPRTVRS